MRILVTHVFGYVNKGDWMLLDALLQSLADAFPGAELLGICRDPASQARYFPQVRWSTQYGTSSRGGLRRRADNVAGLLVGVWRNVVRPSFLPRGAGGRASCFADLDLVVACPGGYLEDSNPSIVSNLAHLQMAVASGAPVILAPQSIGPFHSPFWRRRAAKLLRRTQRVIVRESASERIVRDELQLPDELVQQLPDMAFYDNRVDEAGAEAALAKLGVEPRRFLAATVLDWYFPGSNAPAQARAAYLANVAQVARELRARHGVSTLVLKQVEAGFGTPGDESAMHELHRLAPEAVAVDETNYPPPIMRGIIGRSLAFLGSRMHSNVFALQTGAPLAAIAYLPKTRGMMEMAGLGDQVVDIADFTAEELRAKIDFALDPQNRERFAEAKRRVDALGAEGRREFRRILLDAVAETATRRNR
ncbi:MAG: polysaccharide pyruvyl transferase family protein [Pirellulales bacterium]|nr:polysaccharide pyruvyl transferase family protein [Pirellulales bacterium]